MTQSPEYEPEFYIHQISLMEERYSVLFRKSKISWKEYYSLASNRLNKNAYWIWIFLCGFEKFLKENNFKVKNKELLKKKIYKDAEERILRIVGDTNKIKQYIENLPAATEIHNEFF